MMKFLSVRDLRNKSTEVWQGLTAAREMVLTSNGRPIAILSAVTEETLEETLNAIRQARAITAVSEIGRVKLGQPVPDLYLSSELNNGCPETIST